MHHRRDLDIFSLWTNLVSAIEENRYRTLIALGVAADFRDITTGYCGPYGGYSGAAGWDLCTSVGVVTGKVGK